MTIHELQPTYLTLSYSPHEPNTIHLKIKGEEHTLANILTERLHLDPRCKFAAYKVPHPLEESFELKVSAEKETPVVGLVKEILRELEGDIEKLRGDLEREC